MWRGLADTQSARVREHLPTAIRSLQGGRSRADDRKSFKGILWVLWTGGRGAS